MMSFEQEKIMTVKQNADNKFVHVLDVAKTKRALFVRVYTKLYHNRTYIT